MHAIHRNPHVVEMWNVIIILVVWNVLDALFYEVELQQRCLFDTKWGYSFMCVSSLGSSLLYVS